MTFVLRPTFRTAKTIAVALLILPPCASGQREAEPAAALAIHKVYPPYPYAARDQHLEGSGMYQLKLREDGTVRSVVVLKSTGHKLLDDAAVGALRQWRFRPGVVHDVKVPLFFTMRGKTYTREDLLKQRK